MLRRTSIHSYNIPEEANTGGWCAWSVQQTWPDTSLEWSARLATGVSADPLFNNLALHTQAHGHPSRAPLFSSFLFVKFLSRALTALFRTRIMMDCCICICLQKQANGNTIPHICYGAIGYTGSVASANNYWAGNPKFAGSNLRDDSFYEGSCWLFFNMDLEICGSKHGCLEMFKA